MQRLHDLLTDSALRFPSKAAFLKQGTSTTYAELSTRALGLASALFELGVRRGDRVAILLDADVDYLVAFYGALAAGAAAVPLCTDARTHSLVQTLAHVDAKVLVLDVAQLGLIHGHLHDLSLTGLIVRGTGDLEVPGLTLLSLAEVTRGTVRWSEVATSEDDLAAVIYTSGTTGRPKGVMLSHKNLVANTRSIVASLGLCSEDVAGMVLPFYYVYGSSILHTHLAVGATIAQLGNMTFVGKVWEGLARFGCTNFSGVPATFARLLSVSSLAAYDLSHLRWVTQAGAAMPATLLERLRRALPNVRVHVMYGQTEASARLACLPSERLEDKPGSAGKAIPGVTLQICDPEGRVVPPGTTGEVVAQGDNIMRGYWRDPQATAAVLRPEGLRTGDVGFMDQEGFLFLQGRESELIKSGGHRIGPAEIEQVLGRWPAVRECAVCGVPHDMLGESIVAYLVLDPAQGATTQKDLLPMCHAELPRFKVPSQFIAVDSLPKGPSGKVLRRELKSWYAEGRGRRI